MSRPRKFRIAVIPLVMIGMAGCGGGVPGAGARAEMPPDYKVREKKIADGFKAMMKDQAAAKKKRSR